VLFITQKSENTHEKHGNPLLSQDNNPVQVQITSKVLFI